MTPATEDDGDEFPGNPIITWRGGPDDEVPNFCPEGCGGLTEDPYGGPCKACWAKVDDEECQ